MNKLSTLFKKDPNDLGRVINEVNPENEWVFRDGIPTRKFDGTACAIIEGELYKRFDAKPGRKIPEGAIPCCEADEVTGHHPHWVKCEIADKSNKYHFEAFDSLEDKQNGTYELCGEKVQKNKESIKGHRLIKHGSEVLDIAEPYTFETLKKYLIDPVNDIEGIVFKHRFSIKMCKLRKSDFGIKR